jgi:flap endonuclease-1
MGVRDLNYLIKRYSTNSIKERTLYDLRNKRIAIDLQLYLYKALIQNKDPVEEIFKQIIHLDRFKIMPVYIFEGRPPKEKMAELHKRAIRKSRSMEVIHYLESVYLKDEPNDLVEDDRKVSILSKINELKKNCLSIDKKLKQTIKHLCMVMGVQYVDNPYMEADKTIGLLYQQKQIDGVISEDNDMLVYGCDHLYRFYKTNSSHILEYNLTEIKKDLNLNDSEFTDLCILCGSDYYKNIKFKYIANLKNSVIAYYLIRKYKSLEQLEHYLPENLDYERIRQIYNLNGTDMNNIIISGVKRPVE